MTSTVKSFDNILGAGFAKIDYGNLSNTIKNLGSLNISDDTISAAFKNANFTDEQLATIFKTLDPEDATTLAKAFDQPFIDDILRAAGDDASDLAARIGRQETITDVQFVAGNTKVNTVSYSRLQNNLNELPADARGSAKAGEVATILKNADDDALTNDEIVKLIQQKYPQITKQQIEEILADSVTTLKNSDEAKQAMGALGFVKQSWGNFTTWTAKNWYKLGAALFLLCLMYDTDNPFTALKRAVDDAGVFVRGLKDVADKTVQSGKNAFDVLAWVTGNPFVSVGSSAACVIMMLSIGVSSLK